MKSLKILVVIVATITLLLPCVLLAHHNHQAITNYDVLVGVTGVVTKHEFVNPHTVIHVTATGKDGNAEEWIGYGGNPGMESRIGYSAHMFNVGSERITMYGFAQRDGRKAMTYMKIVRANGEDLPMYQTKRTDLDAFYATHNIKTFKEMPETLKRYIGGQPYQANEDK